MSQFDVLMTRGFDSMLAGLGVAITYDGKTAKCIPASQPVQRELRDSGLWESGMQVVEIKSSELARLGLVQHAVLKIAGKAMKVMTIDRDEADPCVRLTLRPHS